MKEEPEFKKSCVKGATMKTDWTKILGILGSGGLLWTLHSVLPFELRIAVWISIFGVCCWGAKYLLRWIWEAREEWRNLKK